MAKRKKRMVASKKKKDDDDNDFDEPVAKKVAVSSTSLLEDDSSQTSTFSVEGVSIGRSDTIGGEVGFSSHFWCNYCDYSSDTKKELVAHMRQHMTKCSYCNFSSLSRAEIAKHVKCEHADEAEKTICEVDSSSSGTEHDMDKDPCSACIFCDFMTYSTEHLEKHTTSKHQGMLPKSVAKMISKQTSARIRKDDAMFYCAISSENFDKPLSEGENVYNSNYFESNEKKGPIIIESEPEKQNLDVKPNISPHSPIENQKADVKPNPQTLSQGGKKDCVMSDQKKDIITSRTDDWKVKVETLYCLSCPYSNVAIEKLKCHALTQHPESVAAASFTSEATFRLQDITFYCARESCSYSNVQCGDYEDHLIKCCSPPDSLLYGEKERLKDTIKFIFKCQEKQGATKSKDFIEFSSLYVSHPYSYDTSSPINHSDTYNKLQADAPSKSIQCTNDASNTKDHENNSCHYNSNNGSQMPTVQTSIHDTHSKPNDVPQTHTFQGSSNLTQSHIIHGQGENNASVNQNNLTIKQNVDAYNFCQNIPPSSGQILQMSSNTLSNNPFQYQHLNDNHQQNSNPPINNNLQQILNPIVQDDNVQPTSSSVLKTNNYNKSTHSQELISANTNTNISSSGQEHSVYPSENTSNLEPFVAPSFDIQYPVMSDEQNKNQPSFIPHSDSHHQQQQQQQQKQSQQPQSSQDTPLTANNHPTTTSANLYTDVHQQPKMLDLLSDANSVLLDNDLNIQPWPTTHSHDSISSQHSLHTPPLPQDNDPNLSVSSNFPNQGASSNLTLPSQFPINTDIPSSHINQHPQPSIQNTLMSSEAIIDLDSPQHVVQDLTSMNYATDNSLESLTPQTPTEQSEATTSVPNFLVPSSSAAFESTNCQQQPNSFFNNSVQPQPPNQQTLPMDCPSTPPSQKSISPGISRVPVGNSPLSPSIYLSGNAPRQQGTSSFTENSPMSFTGTSPTAPQFKTPPQQGMSPSSQRLASNVRQRLFSRGHPSGPGVQQGMVRPPVKPIDDDVIVTAVVRGPAPQSQRPPVIGRGGRGMVPNARGIGPNARGMGPNARGMGPNARGMAPNVRGMAPNPRNMVPNARGVGPNARGMAPNARGMAPNARGMRGMPQRGRGFPPNGRGLQPNGRGMAPRGRAGMAVQRGRGVARGRGGTIPSPQARRPIDVSGHLVDLACVVNANEEGEEGDEIQIVGVTPGKGGVQKPKAVDAKKFSYCCIHCGQDQGSKVVMKKHIKAKHSDSLLGAFRNVESGQWLYFCPQLTCEFMTYDDIRLTNHLFACYNLDKSKPLPYDMQSALRNLKSLKIRQEGVGHNVVNPNLGRKGLRDAFNNNLKDAFDDMVENSMGRQTIRPNQPSHPPNQRPPPGNGQQQSQFYINQRGALKGPYTQRGTPPKNIRQGFSGPGQMSPNYRQRNPMMTGSPHQPRYPNSPGRPRAPSQLFSPRGISPGRGDPHSMQGPRPPNTQPMLRLPNSSMSGMPGNEQSPIIIDLEVDSPGKVPEDSNGVQDSFPTIATSADNPMDSFTSSVNTLLEVEATPSYPVDNIGNQPCNTPTVESAMPCPLSNKESAAIPAVESHSMLEGQTVPNSPALQTLGGDLLSNSDNSTNNTNLASSDSYSDTCDQITSLSSQANTDPLTDNAQASTSTSQSVPSPNNASAPPTDVKDVPSPSQLLAEMNALSSKQAITPKPPETVLDNTEQESRRTLSPHQNPLQKEIDHNSLPSDNDEELVNTILLDKVFAKVPHMPKKLSQRLVLKFKKYAADRGMIITPTSRVIDEFVSKISYKGSHSAPTPIGGQENKNISEIAQPPPQPIVTNINSTMNNRTGLSSNDASPQPNFDTGSSVVDKQNPSPETTSPSLCSNQTTTTSSTSSVLPTPMTAANSNSSATPSEVVTKSEDVIETKVIFAERKLQFKGAFANIIKEKNTQPQSSSLHSQPSSLSVIDNPEQTSGFSAGSSQSLSPQSHQQSNDESYLHSQRDNCTVESPLPEAESGGNGMTGSTVKKELIEPVSFPSVSKENSIEVKSSVDHIVCGYASLEVDIAGKPLSANAFTDKEASMEGSDKEEKLEYKKEEVPSSICKDLSEKDNVKSSSLESSSGTLKFKIKKGNKPRVMFSGKKEDEIVSEKSEDSDSPASAEDQLIRRSVRKRKAVKVDYGSDELGEMDRLMSDEDDEYHVESDESYDGSDNDERGKKKIKKVKSSQDPTAFDLATKGSFGCWKCSKVFSRVMFLKRHILTKHKEGLCAIVFTETGIPPKDQPSLLLFCPQSCKYVTADSDAFFSHLETCAKSPLDIADINYRNIQEAFFKNDFKQLGESIASGTISTKIPVKPAPISRKKSLASLQSPVTQASKQDTSGTSIVTMATIHHQPQQTAVLPSPPQHAKPPHPPPQPTNLQSFPQSSNQHPSSQSNSQFTKLPPSPQSTNPHTFPQSVPHLHPPPTYLDHMMPEYGHDGYFENEGDMEEMMPGEVDPDMFYQEEANYQK